VVEAAGCTLKGRGVVKRGSTLLRNRRKRKNKHTKEKKWFLLIEIKIKAIPYTVLFVNYL
jgi:hypothetical protein